MADDDMAKALLELSAQFELMAKDGQRRVAKAALRAACREIAKQMQNELAEVKEARVAIGHVVRGVKHVTAKVGVNVGIGRDSQPKQPRRRSGRSGVGIGPSNVHWWIRGTDQRFRGQKRRASVGVARKGAVLRPTGQMPAKKPAFAFLALTRARANMEAAMQERAAAQVQKEFKPNRKG